MSFELTLQFLGNSTIGLFGAGHLGKAIAEGLLKAGLPRQNLAICHRGSKETDRELADLGLSDLVESGEKVVRQSRILFYLVRPQNSQAVRDYKLREDSLFISFLAGIPLNNLPVHLPDAQRVRVMTSAPDTLRNHNGIAALYPQGNLLMREILDSLGLRIVPLGHESDIHAFTALGPCLPIVLTYWEYAGFNTDDHELLETAKKFGISNYSGILQWAHSIRPRQLSPEEINRYLFQAATPGGVTDAILSAMRAGMCLSAALQRGIERSQQLATA
ncbi:MAG: Pyrroline-5-carboxylate reductase [Syntrophus sp. PtaB.Bin001]|nr:MAG: Pyrroline-5-carboxylate reductase [Syntrophus sp. PtaB.Bin001]